MFDTLFDLTQFAHKELFDQEVWWEIFTKLHAYIARQSFKIEGEIESGACLVNPDQISLGKGSIIESGAYVKGPCIVGDHCEIRHGAYVRGDVLTGDRCVIGHATEVKNAIFLNGAKAGHFAYIGDSILGNNVNLGAGTKCANLRFDGKTIAVAGKKTELRKLGALFGDGAQTGCNAVTNPGTVMEKKSWCRPCATPKGVISAGSRAAKPL